MPKKNQRDEQSLLKKERQDAECSRIRLAALFRKCYPNLVRSLRRMGRGQSDGVKIEDCEEAVQQAFLEFWKKPCENRGEAATVSYLRRAAGTRLLNQLIKNSAQRRREQGHSDAIGSGDPRPAEVLWAQEREERVRWAVSQLSSQQRQAIELLDLEGLTATEAANKLGCTVDTLRGRRKRAKAFLFQILRVCDE